MGLRRATLSAVARRAPLGCSSSAARTCLECEKRFATDVTVALGQSVTLAVQL